MILVISNETHLSMQLLLEQVLHLTSYRAFNFCDFCPKGADYKETNHAWSIRKIIESVVRKRLLSYY